MRFLNKIYQSLNFVVKILIEKRINNYLSYKGLSMLLIRFSSVNKKNKKNNIRPIILLLLLFIIIIIFLFQGFNFSN